MRSLTAIAAELRAGSPCVVGGMIWPCSDCSLMIEAAAALEMINATSGVKLRPSVVGEIDEVAGRIANGAATCGATWRDTEARGWVWYCSLPIGHDGHHRCIGATW